MILGIKNTHTNTQIIKLLLAVTLKAVYTSIAAMGLVPYSLYKPVRHQLIFKVYCRNSPLKGSKLPA